jgi:parvulin-like peptidyl-prolyl isomerase
MQRTLMLLGLLAVIVVAGCKKQEAYVAKVGKEVITEQEYNDAMMTQFRTVENISQRTLDERKKILHDMALEEAKYQEGLARKYDENPEISQNLENAVKRRALDLLYTEKIIDAVITEDMIKDFYENSSKEVNARHILVKKSASDTTDADKAKLKARIDSIKTAIEKGLDFKVAAATLNDDVSTVADSGALGWFPWGRMVDEFQRAAWKATPHKLAGPVESPFGWHLIMVDSVRQVEGRKPFEESKEEISTRMRESEGQKLSEKAREYVNALHGEYGLKLEDNVIKIFTDKVNDPTTPLNKELGPVFTEEQKTQVAATHKLGTVTINDMLEKVGANAYRVDWKNPQSVIDLTNAICEPQFLEDKAAKEGYIKRALEDPAVVAQKKSAIQRLIEKVEVTDKLSTDENSDKAYYDQHLQDFIQAETRTVREIFIKDDSTKAERVRERAQKGENFQKLAWQFNEKESTKSDTGRIGPFEEKRFGLIGKTAFRLEKIGDVSEVVKVGKNFSVLQLLGIYPSRTKTWDEAKSDARRENRVVRTKQLQDDLEKMLFSRYPLTMNEEKLKTMWPLPPERQERSARDQ